MAADIGSEAVVSAQLRVAALRHMFAQEKSGAILSLIGVAAITLAAWTSASGPWLLVAILLRLLCTAVIFYCSHAIIKTIDAGKPFERELRRFEWVMVFSGLTWGLLAWPFSGTLQSDMPTLVITLTVMLSMAVMLLTVSIEPRMMKRALIPFAVVFLMPVFLNYQSTGILPAVGATCFVLAMGMYAKRHGERSLGWMRVRFENQRLAEALAETNTRLSDALEAAEKLAEEDSLTGLLNRRAFERYAGDLLRDAPDDCDVYLMLGDLDRFKAINDNFGHSIGDVVLELTAEVLMDAAGKDAICARWGGEEFLIAMTASDQVEAKDFVRTLKQEIRAVSNRLGIDGIAVSASFGLSKWRINEDMDAAVARADKAMYTEKSAMQAAHGDRRYSAQSTG